MDSFELNKIFGALLGSLLLVLAVAKIVSLVHHPKELEKKAYIVEGVQEEGATATAEAAPAAVPMPVMLAKADAAKGEKVSKQCLSCHSFEQGGADKQGPNLFGIVGNKLAHKDGFNYSAAFKTAHESGKTWTYDALWAYLNNPKAFLPGNNMSFAGVKKDDQRADLIAYLKTISPSAPPFPAAEAAPAPEGGTPAPQQATPGGSSAPH